MSFAFPADRFSSQKNIQRGAAITLLLLIHALVLGVLMNTRQSPEPLSQSVREIIVSFPIFRPRPIPRKQRPSRVHARIRSSTRWRFDLPHGVIPPATQPEWSGVGHVLFGCDPAMMLNPDQSAGCSALTAARVPEEVGMPKKSRVVQTAAVKIWQSLGYAPAKVRGAWGDMLKAYLDNFPDKSFNIGYIGLNAFPGIKDDGSAAATPDEAATLSGQFTATLIADAAAAMPGRLALGFDSVTLNVPPRDVSYTQYLDAFFAAGAKVRLGWQTNELLQQAGGAACGGSMPRNAVPCQSSDEFQAMLFGGLYPQGRDTPPNRQGVYLELFPQNINAYPDAVRAAHGNLADWHGGH